MKGSHANSYHVKINIAHIRQSQCDCPHANGKRIICKHMVALFFTAFPKEAANYKAEVDQYETEEEERIQAYYDELANRIKRLTKKHLQEELLATTIELEEIKSYYW